MRNRLFRRAIAAAAVGATASLGVLAGAASASTTPPAPNANFVGTWVNTNSATLSVKQIDVVRTDTGGILVDAFGACTPTLCEWGKVPAIIYGANVSSLVGGTFQTDQAFLANGKEWSRTQLQAALTVTATGAKFLTVRELTAFEDGSGRHNYTVVESFAPGKGQAPTTFGVNAAGYPFGFPPAAIAGLAGNWKATSNAVVKLSITIAGGVPSIHAFGSCSPTACDMGTVRGITYGPNISATTGKVVLAPFAFGFKNEQLVIVYQPGTTALQDRLIVANYNEFTDGSGRSNYVVSEVFARS